MDGMAWRIKELALPFSKSPGAMEVTEQTRRAKE
jgi:hypothetical protein